MSPGAAAWGPALPRLPGAAEADRQRRAVADLLGAFPGALVVLEDVHDDPVALAFLQAAATRPPGFGVVATARDDGPAAGRLRATPGLRGIALGPLSDSVMVAMAAEQLGERALPPDVAPLVAACAGNPLLLGEALAAWAGGHALSGPVDLAHVVQARLAGLGPDARAVLAAVVALAEHADTARIAAVVGRDPGDVAGEIAAAVRERWLEDRDDHVALACAPFAPWIAVDTATHAAAAAALVDTGDDAAVGEHLLAAGRASEATPWLERAAAAAQAAGEIEEAARLWAAVERVAPAPSASRFAARRELAVVLRLLGRLDAAQVAADDAVAEADALGDPVARIRAAIALAMVQRIREPARSSATLEAAAALARDIGALGLLGVVLGQIGAWHAERDDYPAAVPYWREALVAAEAAGDERQALRLRGDLATAAEIAGDLDAALGAYHDVLTRQLALDQAFEASFTVGNLAILHLKRGELDLARQTAERALATKRAFGYRRGEAFELLSLADVAQVAGDFAAATQVAVDAREILRDIGEQGWVAKVDARIAAWARGERTPVV